MVFIDDAGVGCFLGKPVIVGYRKETGETIIKHMKCNDHDHIRSLSTKILKELNVDKEEEIFVCHGSYFTQFRKYLKKNNYNFTSCVIGEEAQDIVENAFLEHLYSLGLPRSIKLYGKEYRQFDEEVLTGVIANPNLLKHVRKLRGLKKSIERMDRIEKALFYCPNLIREIAM